MKPSLAAKLAYWKSSAQRSRPWRVGAGSSIPRTAAAGQPLPLSRPGRHGGPAANPRRSGLDQPQHHLHRGRGVCPAAAELEDRVARLHRQRVRRRDHEALCSNGVTTENGRTKNKKGSLSRPRKKQESLVENHTIKGTTSNATMLMILISGLTAGPAVSL